MNIVHITPHLGGGVGRVLLSWCTKAKVLYPKTLHSILSLEDANDAAKQWAAKEGIPLADEIGQKPQTMFASIETADIVVVHWWNHPLLYKLFVNIPLPRCRLIVWSHVSGHTMPHIFTQRLIHFPDCFVVSTPYSFDAHEIRTLDQQTKLEKVRLVFTCAGTERVETVEKTPHDGFNVGYVGTVDYCKLHPHFLRMSMAAGLRDAHFIVCGGEKQDEIRAEATKLGIGGHFEFTGKVSNVNSYLSVFDVFGYPLCKEHYGTGEQALIEAMAVGLPVVVFDNGSERALVEHEKTGLVVGSEMEYSAALQRLQNDNAFRKKLGSQAKQTARQRFSLDTMVSSWENVFREIFQNAKTGHQWNNGAPIDDGAQLFVESLGIAGGLFKKSMQPKQEPLCIEADGEISKLGGSFRSQTRGSTFHYRSFFPDNAYLNMWCGCIEMSQRQFEKALLSFIAAKSLGQWRVACYAGCALQALGRGDEAAWYFSLAKQLGQTAEIGDLFK